MKNKVSFWPFFIALLLLGLSGVWGLAHWSSPNGIGGSSRSTASSSTARLLRQAKQSKTLPQEKIKIKKRTPANINKWFHNSQEKAYQGRNYLVSTNVFALPKNRFKRDGGVIEERDGWVFFKKTSTEKQAYHLWLNTNNQEILIESGRILVELRESGNIQKIQDIYDLEVVYQAPGRPLFLLASKTHRVTKQLIKDLVRETSVTKVERELINPGLRPR